MSDEYLAPPNLKQVRFLLKNIVPVLRRHDWPCMSMGVGYGCCLYGLVEFCRIEFLHSKSAANFCWAFGIAVACFLYNPCPFFMKEIDLAFREIRAIEAAKSVCVDDSGDLQIESGKPKSDEPEDKNTLDLTYDLEIYGD